LTAGRASLILEVMSEARADKQKRERSKAYPGTSLEDCVGYVREIKTNLGKGIHDRDSLARALGFERATGAVNPKIASLVHFGFLDRAEGGYELSPNALKITDPISESEAKEEVRAAFHRPVLYQEILEKFKQEGQIPLQLATHLHRFHGITDAASGTAADIFLESGRFAGVLDQSNRFVADETAPRDRNGNEQENGAAESMIEDRAPVEKGDVAKDRAAIEHPPKSIPGSQRFEFAVTGGHTVVLIVPAQLNDKDIKIIRKQVELLELQASIDEESE
jgi:hypothetical protein